MRDARSVVTVLLLAVLALLVPQRSAVAQPGEGVVQVHTAWSLDKAHAGDQRALAVVFDIAPRYHINPDQPQIPNEFEYLIATTVSVVDPPAALKVGSPQFPMPHDVEVNYSGTPEKIKSYEGRTVVYLPVIVAEDAAVGELPVKVRVKYQACDDQTCLPPRTVTLDTVLTVVPMGEPIAASDGGELFAGFDSSAFAKILAGQVAAPAGAAAGSSLLKNDFFGLQFSLDTSTASGLSLVLLVALVAGFLLNFTPCVLPVIPIKILSLHQQAKDPAKTLRLGIVFGLGIVGSFAVLGAMVAGLVSGLEQLEWGQIFSNRWVSLTLAAIIVAMALGMFDLYAIRLPRSVYMLNPSHDTATGNVLMGVLTAVLSTPCTGPMLGATIAWAVKQPAWMSLLTFCTMGLGMALPYVVLTMNPKWIDRLPRTGPGSALVKQVMGLLLIAVAAFFIGPLIPGQAEWWLVAAFVVAAMLWLVVRTFGISAKVAPRVAAVLVAVLLSFASVSVARLLTDHGPIPWRPFTTAEFQRSLADGDTVLLEFTADWCGNCKALELTTYRDDRLAEFFGRDGYAAYKIDLTSSDNEEGWALQRKLGGGGGIPLAAVYVMGQSEPAATFQGLFTPEQLLRALEGK